MADELPAQASVRPGSDAGPDPGDPAPAPGHVKLIYFNDPRADRRGPDDTPAGHDDHLHVRYCEVMAPGHRVSLRVGP